MMFLYSLQLHGFLASVRDCANPLKLHVRLELATYFIAEVQYEYNA